MQRTWAQVGGKLTLLSLPPTPLLALCFSPASTVDNSRRVTRYRSYRGIGWCLFRLMSSAGVGFWRDVWCSHSDLECWSTHLKLSLHVAPCGRTVRRRSASKSSTAFAAAPMNTSLTYVIRIRKYDDGHRFWDISQPHRASLRIFAHSSVRLFRVIRSATLRTLTMRLLRACDAASVMSPAIL